MLKIKAFIYENNLGPCALNEKGTPKGKLTLRTSVITHGSKGELALMGQLFIWCTRA